MAIKYVVLTYVLHVRGCCKCGVTYSNLRTVCCRSFLSTVLPPGVAVNAMMVANVRARVQRDVARGTIQPRAWTFEYVLY